MCREIAGYFEVHIKNRAYTWDDYSYTPSYGIDSSFLRVPMNSVVLAGASNVETFELQRIFCCHSVPFILAVHFSPHISQIDLAADPTGPHSLR